MSALETVRDQLKASVAEAQASVAAANSVLSAHTTALAAVEAEIEKAPTLADVKAMLDRIAP